MPHQAYEDSYEGDEPHGEEHREAYVAMVRDELVDGHQLRRPEQLKTEKCYGGPLQYRHSENGLLHSMGNVLVQVKNVSKLKGSLNSNQPNF